MRERHFGKRVKYGKSFHSPHSPCFLTLAALLAAAVPMRAASAGEARPELLRLSRTFRVPAPARATPPPPAPVPAPPPVTVPLTLLKTRHIVVSAKVNGAGPFRLVLDTGSPVTFISGAAGVKSGLITEDALKRPVMLGMRGQGTARTFELAGAVVKNLPLMILDHPIVEALSQIDGPVDGLIGHSFLARFRTTLDYAAGKVTFVPVRYQPQEVLSNLIGRIFSQDIPAVVVAPPALWGMAVDKGDDNPGVRVRQVYPRSAAEAAGLRAGDRLLTLDGRWTDSDRDCWQAAALVRPGQTALLRIERDGRELDLKLRPRLGL